MPGWHIRRVGPVYRLMHGRTNIGEIEDVNIRGHDRPDTFCVLLASGLCVLFPIREPRRPEE